MSNDPVQHHVAPGTGGSLPIGDRVALLLISLAIFLPGTFGVSFTDRDEGWYAEVTREMLDSGDWLVPRYLGQPWIGKPPLLYWCVGGLWRVFGQQEWAGRLVSVIAMAAVVQLLAALAAALYGRRVAWIAAVSFVTAGMPVILGRLMITDALLLLWMLAAMCALWRTSERGATLCGGMVFWLYVGLAVLTKGPVVALFLAGFGLALLKSARSRRWLASWRLWLPCPVAIMIAAPWYWYIGRHGGGALAEQFLGYEIISRFTEPPHGHVGPPGYYAVVGLAGWMPWSVLVPGALFEAWRARRDDRRAMLLVIWFVVPWLLLELIPGKLPHYVLPCFVPLAIMFGRMWDRGVDATITAGQRVVLFVWIALAAACGGALAGAGYFGSGQTWGSAALVCGGALVGGFVLVAWFAARRRLIVTWATAAGVTGVFHVMVGLCLLPSLEAHRLSVNVAKRANALMTPDVELVATTDEEPTIYYYLKRQARIVPRGEIAQELTCTGQSRVVIVAGELLDRAGLASGTEAAGWNGVTGFNYVKGRYETVWVVAVCPN